MLRYLRCLETKDTAGHSGTVPLCYWLILFSAKVQHFQQTAMKRIDESFFISPESSHKAVVAEWVGDDIGKGMVSIEVSLILIHTFA